MACITRILITHESKESIEILTNILTRFKYQLFESRNICEAKRVLEAQSIDLVITSLNLPKRSSSKLIHTVNSIQPKIPIIIATEKRRLEAIRECSRVGGDGFITYPLKAKNIAITIKRTLELADKKFARKNAPSKRETDRYLAGYNLKGVLGKGSMGIVYLAEKANSGAVKPYALKVLQKSIGRRTEEHKRELLERFLREAEAASKLRHPNIVRIIDFGIEEELLIPYIVMDFIPGRSLRHFIGNSSLSHVQRATIVRQVADALTAIHSHHICHRDIKPENIIMDAELNVKLTDFGVARLPNSDLTQVIKIIGTPSYMAPEAFSCARVDYKADIFSLGVVAYELFLGKKPFYSNTITGYRRKIPNERPIEPRKIDKTFPAELQCILAKLLKKDPDARFDSAAAIVSSLNKFLDCTANKAATTSVDLVEYFENSQPLAKHHLERDERGEDWK